MSFPDLRSPFMPSLGPQSACSGASVGLCPHQFPINDDFQGQGPPFKRLKTSRSNSLSEIHSNSLFYPSMSNHSLINCWPQFPTKNEDQHPQFEHQILPPLKKPRISEECRSNCLPCPPVNNGMSVDDIGFWIQNSQFEHPPPPFKKPRISEETQSNSLRYPPLASSINPPPSGPSSSGIRTDTIFFKPSVSAKFKVGLCRNGENCNFAHGIEDMRQPPPNSQELAEDRLPLGNCDGDQELIHWMKRCSFIHEHPAKVGDKLGGFSQSRVLGTVNGRGCNGSEGNRSVNNTSSDSLRVNSNPAYWKTKLCKKWETRGLCSLGEKCHFAHGQEELLVLRWTNRSRSQE
ncbi:zinc finger CCCH domain-containing protein 39 [Ziziphus jujuba]|uniref:Zinc finger CCCH domain-containing protein 39 n=1 Tax=Ziziphus jujuba TaxID=326968 RepID=A0A6P4BA32_ZIZJJ|nr:zinc finger CCCH domain-containing protein 39 [Ziziphus jujuba]